jgi:hypothetical protein
MTGTSHFVISKVWQEGETKVTELAAVSDPCVTLKVLKKSGHKPSG